MANGSYFRFNDVDSNDDDNNNVDDDDGDYDDKMKYKYPSDPWNINGSADNSEPYIVHTMV